MWTTVLHNAQLPSQKCYLPWTFLQNRCALTVFQRFVTVYAENGTLWQAQNGVAFGRTVKMVQHNPRHIQRTQSAGKALHRQDSFDGVRQCSTLRSMTFVNLDRAKLYGSALKDSMARVWFPVLISKQLLQNFILKLSLMNFLWLW